MLTAVTYTQAGNITTGSVLYCFVVTRSEFLEIVILTATGDIIADVRAFWACVNDVLVMV